MPKPHGALGYRPPAPETVPQHRPVPAFAHEGLDANLRELYRIVPAWSLTAVVSGRRTAPERVA